MEKGMEKGEEIGEQKKAIAGIRNMLKKEFDGILIADILEVKPHFVLEIRNQLSKEPEIIAALKKNKGKPDMIAKQIGVSPLLVEVIKDSMR